MKLTKIFLHLLTVLNLIAAIGLGAMAVLYLFGTRGAGTAQGYLYANLAIGGVLAAIVFQIVVIGVKFGNGQDVKRELRVVVFMVALLLLVAVVALSGYQLAGLVGLMLVALLFLLALLVLLVLWVLAGRGA